MKLIFTPIGLIVILILIAIIFLPRRLPDVMKKTRRPMRAFPDEFKTPDGSPGEGPEGSKKS